MLTLFYSPGACSLAAHVVLEELGLEFERRPVLLAEGQHLSDDYLRINPRGRVPALIADGAVITEVPAILTYLASLKRESGLLPPDGSLELARAQELAAFLSSTLHIDYAQLWRPGRFLPEGADSTMLVDHARTLIHQHSSEIERWIKRPWVLGDCYSIADAYLLPFYRWGNRIGFSMAREFPRWAEWTGRMLERPAVAKTISIEGISQFD
jgi:glutathione S-transferase